MAPGWFLSPMMKDKTTSYLWMDPVEVAICLQLTLSADQWLQSTPLGVVHLPTSHLPSGYLVSGHFPEGHSPSGHLPRSHV